MDRRKSPPLNLLEPVQDARTASDLIERLDGIVDCPGRLRLDALDALQWVAAPVETANHLDEDTVSRLVNHCKDAGIKSLFAIETERDVTKRESYSLPVSTEGLGSFNWELGLMYCALFPPTLGWLILCTKDDHYVVAGSLEFVEAILAKPVGQAVKEFGELASDSAWTPAEREFLQGVAERYAAANACLAKRG